MDKSGHGGTQVTPGLLPRRVEAVASPKLADERTLRMCFSEQDAIAASITLSGLTYREIAARYLDAKGRGRDGFRAVFDARQQAWHLHDAKRQLYLGYDDPRAVEAKARWARAQGLAGVFAWELDQDNGALLNAMNRGSGQRLLAP